MAGIESIASNMAKSHRQATHKVLYEHNRTEVPSLPPPEPNSMCSSFCEFVFVTVFVAGSYYAGKKTYEFVKNYLSSKSKEE